MTNKYANRFADFNVSHQCDVKSRWFRLILGCRGNNSNPGEDGAESSVAFWSEGQQFNWKCKLRSHVSPR